MREVRLAMHDINLLMVIHKHTFNNNNDYKTIKFDQTIDLRLS